MECDQCHSRTFFQVEAPAVRHTAAHAPDNRGLNNSLDYVAADWSRVILHPHVAGRVTSYMSTFLFLHVQTMRSCEHFLVALGSDYSYCFWFRLCQHSYYFIFRLCQHSYCFRFRLCERQLGARLFRDHSGPILYFM